MQQSKVTGAEKQESVSLFHFWRNYRGYDYMQPENTSLYN